MKKDPIELAVYIATGLFLAYLIYICFIAEPDQFLFGNVFIKTDPIDFGGFGGLLSGIFAPLAFLWLILNFRQQDKNLKIAEEQLKILIQEKTNRRKVTKANFHTEPTKAVFYTSPNVLVFKVMLKSDRDLVDCYSNGFDENIPFALIESWAKNEINLFKTVKNINKDEIFYLNIHFYFNDGYENLNVLERNIQIHYLDADGFDQTQNFLVSIYIEGSNAFVKYNKENTALLFIHPKNG